MMVGKYINNYNKIVGVNNSVGFYPLVMHIWLMGAEIPQDGDPEGRLLTPVKCTTQVFSN